MAGVGASTRAEGEVTVYTIGHSTHALERFLALLERHGIGLVIDTRARPYSRFNPQFNRECLQRALGARSIAYLWLGDRLSGRSRDPAFYDARGRVLWAKLARAPTTEEGLDRVVALAGAARLALMCAEEDPRRCHRRFLLTPPLTGRGLRVVHIRGDGRLVPEDELRREAAGSPGQLALFATSSAGGHAASTRRPGRR